MDRKVTRNYGYLVVLSALLGGCSSSDDGTSVDPVVEATSTVDIKTAAANGIGDNLGAGLNGAGSVINQNATFLEDSPLGGLTGSGEWSVNPVKPVAVGPDTETQSFMDTTLGLDEGSGATTTRVGSLITIDPDDAEVCSEGFLSEGESAADIQRCETLVGDVIVQINAISDVAGTVTFLFQNQPLVVIGYAPGADSFEINFAGVKLLSDAGNALDPDYIAEEDLTLDVFQGAVKVTASTTNMTEGQEAGSVSLMVTQPINMSDTSQGISVQIGVSTIFAIAVDAGTGSGSLEIDIGAIEQISPVGAEVYKLNLPGLTGNAEISANSGVLTVSNFGISSGPFTYTVDDAEALRIALETFGFTVSQATGETIIDGNLNLNWFLDETLISASNSSDGDSLFQPLLRTIEITAPSGTGFIEQRNGSLLVSGVGPLSYSLNATDGNGQVAKSVSATVSAGQCFSGGDSDTDMGAAVVPCD